MPGADIQRAHGRRAIYNLCVRRAGLISLAISCIAQVLIYLVAAPEHVVAATWPLHARFHVGQAIGWVVAANIVVAALVLGPLARGDRRAWWALVTAWLPLHGSYFVAMLAVPGGGPPDLAAHVIVAVPAGLYAIGLVLARPSRVRPAMLG